VKGRVATRPPATRERQIEGNCKRTRRLAGRGFTAESAENAELRSRRRSNPRPLFRSIRGGDLTASGAVKSPAPARRPPWWGFHRSRGGQIPVPRSAPAVVWISPLQRRPSPRPALRVSSLGISPLQTRQNPRSALGASRGGEFTAPDAVKSPVRARRQPWWGIHRSRRGQIPGPRSAPAAVGNSPLRRRSNPRPTLRASRGGEFTAPEAVKSPAHPRRPPWCGYHRERAEHAESRTASIPRSRLTAIARAIRRSFAGQCPTQSKKSQSLAVRAFAGHRPPGPHNIHDVVLLTALRALRGRRIPLRFSPQSPVLRRQ
jgi:hypothetical protein